MESENLGEFLAGDRIESSPYKIYMQVDMFCEQTCVQHLGRGETPEAKAQDKKSKHKVSPNKIIRTIRKKYHNNWIVDNLPAASKMEIGDDNTDTNYARGFPVGFVDSETQYSYINNHVNIELQYHADESVQDKFRVVGFVIEPFSIRHKFDVVVGDDDKEDDTTVEIKNPILSCKYGTEQHTTSHMIKESQPASGNVLFTYDVIWTENKQLHWASRWDIYLNMNGQYSARVHWLSIVNSLTIVFVLTAMIAVILVRNLRRDYARYSAIPTDEERTEDLEEYGWKLVHADVFRPPSYPMVISVFCGSGVQLFLMALFTIIFAALGFLNPANRGSLLMGLLLLYVFMGCFNGYTTARIYKTFKGKNWQQATMSTAFGLPGLAFAIFFIMDLLAISKESTDAVPFSTMIVLLVLWFGISTPLVFFGAYLGFKQDALEFPVNTSNIPRQIPDQPWFMGTVPTLILAGVMPFGACFLELYFIMASIWMDQYYYVFGFLFLVFLILLLTCAEIAILYNYFQLCGEDYQWWWRSYTTAGSTALYIFGYSFIYFKRLEANAIDSVSFAIYFLYFGYMALLSFMTFLVTGTVGLFSCLWFNKTIFGSIKID